jgi:hypothetical protein
MKFTMIRITLLVVISLFASACEKEAPLEPESLKPEVIRDYMPLGKGSTWKYAVEMQDNGKIEKHEAEVYATWTERVRGVDYQRIDGMAIIAPQVWYGVKKWMLLRNDGNIVTEVDEDREYTFLKPPLEVGAKWEVTADDSTITWGEILAIETVLVPAGEFRNCLKVRYTVQDTDDKRLRDEYAVLWIAPNVGLVKSESKEEDFVLSELVSYSIKNLPRFIAKIISNSPADGEKIEVPGGEFKIQFDYPPKFVLVNGEEIVFKGTIATWNLWKYKTGESEFQIEWEDEEGRKQQVIKLNVIVIVKFDPPDGGEMPANGQLKISFDNAVKLVTVNGIPAEGFDKSWTWHAVGLTPGVRKLTIEWMNDDGSKTSYYIIVNVSYIIELKSSAIELESGDTATIEAQVEYSGQESFLSYTWSATGGGIVGSGKRVVYIAPEEPGVQTITLTVTDGVVINQKSVTISVKAISGTLTIGSNTHWPAKALNDVLRYEVTVDRVSRNRVELKYDITQDQDKVDIFLSITINGTTVLNRKAIGGFIPSTAKRTVDKIDASNVIQAPGKYIIEFSLELINLVKNGWLLNEAKLIGVEGRAERL